MIGGERFSVRPPAVPHGAFSSLQPLAFKERPTIAVCGQGSFELVLQQVGTRATAFGFQSRHVGHRRNSSRDRSTTVQGLQQITNRAGQIFFQRAGVRPDALILFPAKLLKQKFLKKFWCRS